MENQAGLYLWCIIENIINYSLSLLCLHNACLIIFCACIVHGHNTLYYVIV